MPDEERRDGYIKLHEDVATLTALMTESRNDTSEIKHMLLGNGQPGIIQRLASLEGFRWYLAGGFATALFLGTVLELYLHLLLGR